MMVREIERPTPMPCSLVVTKGWNSWSAIAGAMPVPVSATSIRTVSASIWLTEMVSSLTGISYIASIAFRTRFSKTCCTWIRSARTNSAIVS